MKRALLVALPCAVIATAAVLAVSGAFRGRGPDPTAPEAGDNRRPDAPAANAVAARPLHQPYPFRRVVVVAVGINHYPGLRGTTDLRYAEADAAEVADVLETLYGFEVVRLSAERATKREVELTLKRYAEELGEEDALVAYFAGHGQVVPLPSGEEAGYLLPADADLDLTDTGDPARWAAQAIDMQLLCDLLDGANARHVVIMADACCSGFLTRRGALGRADLKTFLLGDKSRTVLAAATRRQSAREDAATRHGYFTAALLAELRKEDAASVIDLYVPVMKGVAARTNGAMTPQFGQLGAGDGMFVFVPKSIPRSQVEADLNGRTLGDAPAGGLAAVQVRARERAGARTTFAEVVEAYEAHPYRYSTTPEESARRWEAKLARLKESAGLGDAWAMAALSLCFEKGLGTEKSPDQAYHWARQADRVTTPAGVGRFAVARCYETGTGVVANGPAAVKLLGESADAGYPLARFARGRRVAEKARPGLAGLSGAERAAAEADLTRAFEAGVPSAAVPLARFVLCDTKADRPAVAAAVKRLEEVAEKGCPEAHYALWQVYAVGRENSPARNVVAAKAHLRRAAEGGHAAAQRDIAAEYYRLAGEFFAPEPATDMPQDFESAFRWATLSAKQEDPVGHFLVARMYRAGNGVASDLRQYRAHLDAASRLGAPAAMNELFWELCRGEVYEQDFARALRTAEQSAALGHADGHYNLGYYYLAMLDPDTGKISHREGVETFLHHDHANTHRSLHHYWQAYKASKHAGAKRFLESYWKSHAENPTNLEVDQDLRKHYPETARELFAATDFAARE